MKKILLVSLIFISIMVNCVFVFAQENTTISLDKVVQNQDKSIQVNGTIKNSVENQNITFMVTEYVNGSYDENKIVYIDQRDANLNESGQFSVKFLLSDLSEKGKSYIVRVGGTNIENPEYWIIIYDDSGEAKIFYGDINGDGALNTKDVTDLLNYVLGADIKIDEKAADVTGNGIITADQASNILFKVLDKGFLFPVEKQN